MRARAWNHKQMYLMSWKSCCSTPADVQVTDVGNLLLSLNSLSYGAAAQPQKADVTAYD